MRDRAGDVDWTVGSSTDHDSDGCSNGDEDTDDDDDGVLNVDDGCPRVVVAWVPDESNGADGDGVDNASDESPDSSLGVETDAYGRALVQLPLYVFVVCDADPDGIRDSEDACLEIATGPDLDGDLCPDVGDWDVDGVLNSQDACPSGATSWESTVMSDPDNGGCRTVLVAGFDQRNEGWGMITSDWQSDVEVGDGSTDWRAGEGSPVGAITYYRTITRLSDWQWASAPSDWLGDQGAKLFGAPAFDVHTNVWDDISSFNVRLEGDGPNINGELTDPTPGEWISYAVPTERGEFGDHLDGNECRRLLESLSGLAIQLETGGGLSEAVRLDSVRFV